MKQLMSLDVEDATIMINAAVKKSKEINVLETICVVDNAGFPIKMERMDNARVTGPQISWNKAFTAATHKRSTHLFNKSPNGPALPGNEAFGIQLSFEGKFAVFVGGFPICINDNVVGGIGMSGGNGEEEVEFFDLHIVSDEIHGERGFQIVLEHANTLELQSKCLKICEIGAEMRLLYTTALFNDYVKNDLSLEELETAA